MHGQHVASRREVDAVTCMHLGQRQATPQLQPRPHHRRRRARRCRLGLRCPGGGCPCGSSRGRRRTCRRWRWTVVDHAALVPTNDLLQLDIEIQVRIRGYLAAALAAEGESTGHAEHAAFAEAHLEHAEIPTEHHLLKPHGELEGLLPGPGVVKLRAVREVGLEVYDDLVHGLRKGRPIARRCLGQRQAVGAVADDEELQLEVEVRVRGHLAVRTSAVRQRARDVQHRALPEAHLREADLPALDNSTTTDGKAKGLFPFPGGIEERPVRQGTDVVHVDVVALLGECLTISR
mmetsp:Transcript_174022/g.557905  ORF Transcript_174022/g.557905 Transcript_174022/m.557905 type:complete len:291 (-) Transcript_174022:287-1159(-)